MGVITSAAQALRDARSTAGLTQVEMGRRAGVTQSVISAYESGRREPTLPVLLALLRATGHGLATTAVLEAEGPQVSRVPLSGPLGRRLTRHRRAVRRAAARIGVNRVQVFGSVARGTERPDSDVDLLIDLPEGVGLFELGRLRRELEELLGAPVDLVPEAGLRPEVARAVALELVEL